MLTHINTHTYNIITIINKIIKIKMMMSFH